VLPADALCVSANGEVLDPLLPLPGLSSPPDVPGSGLPHLPRTVRRDMMGA
jgi:hypothetical protein